DLQGQFNWIAKQTGIASAKATLHTMALCTPNKKPAMEAGLYAIANSRLFGHADCCLISQAGQSSLADSVHLDQIIHAGEIAMLLAMLNDRRGLYLSNPRQFSQFFLCRSIDIDLCQRNAGNQQGRAQSQN